MWVEQLIGRCTLITNSPSWLTPTGGFFYVCQATTMIMGIHPELTEYG
ncbi:hypothetical protein [Nostoc parmelioides]|nr:hypothetical protein [Nostoc parmelioides]